MHRIDREIAFLQVLLERQVVVSCFFHQDEAVLKRRKALYPLEEGAETLSRVLEGKRWTRLKALMALEKGGRDKACSMLHLAHINANIQGLVLEERNGLKIGTLFRLFSHR